jgi:peptide deformylase
MHKQTKCKGVLLQVAQLGHPVLRRKASKVKDVKEENIKKLINDLITTVLDVDGVGISAPQVYQPLKIFIIASHPNPRYPDAPKMKPTAVINPKIISYLKETTKDWEGCLSVPGIRALIPRYRLINVEYTDINGQKKKKNFKDFIARIFQHEYDHLEGTVFLDRIESTKEIITEKEYQKMFKRKNEKNNKKHLKR